MIFLQVTQVEWNEIIGRWHPVLVHLPIGFLLLAVILWFLERYPRFALVKPAIPVVLFLGMFSAVISCIAGYCLSLSGGYDEAILNKHKWLGIGVAVVAVLLFLSFLKRVSHSRISSVKNIFWIIIFVLIILTGHYGGALTHGSDYLTQTFPTFFQQWIGSRSSLSAKPVIRDVQEARVYHDIIKPVLALKCYSCHNGDKEKGGLRLDSTRFILEGGEDGKVLVPGRPEESELFRRITLDEDADEHMPPKGRPQLSFRETLLLRWWIEQGCPFDKKVSQLNQPASIKPILEDLQQKGDQNLFVPTVNVSAASEDDIATAGKTGVRILPLAAGTHYLEADAINATGFNDKNASQLLPLKKQLVWLYLGNTQLSDNGLKTISQLSSLTRLRLENTAVSDSGMKYISSLKQLKYLNLAGTHVTDAGIIQLSSLLQLKELYVGNTPVTARGANALRLKLPKLLIDTGRYQIPQLPSDTIVY